jgi:hypothetical protein
MHPGTPHTIITITPSICHGGHCYAASTIRETCISLKITFVANSLLTNMDHSQEGMLLLQSMMRFWLQMLQSLVDGMQCSIYSLVYSLPSLDEDSSMAHMPNIFTLDGIVNIYYIVIVLEMDNILHPVTYTVEGMPGKECLEQIDGCQDACMVCQLIWLLFNYDTSQYNPKLKLKYSLEELYWQCLSYIRKI